jgi:HEAT repeat protein
MPREIPTSELTRTCEEYWTKLSKDDPNLIGDFTANYDGYVHALNELSKRGPEILDWSLKLLKHPYYGAREDGAFLLGQLGERLQLGDRKQEVVRDLGTLALSPVKEDAKETQAIDAAIASLGKIGDTNGVAVIRTILFSEKPYLTGDTKWGAAEALGKLVHEQFMKRPNPVKAAQDWLRQHPDK